MKRHALRPTLNDEATVNSEDCVPYTSGMSGGSLLAGSVLVPGGGALAELSRILLLVAGGVFGVYALVMMGFIVWGRITPQTTCAAGSGRWTSRGR